MYSIAIASLLALACAGFAETYHVAPDGDDGAAGSAEAPWASFEHAAQAAEAGDTVLFASGVYRLQRRVTFAHSGDADNWITYAAADGERPIFDASLLWLGERGMDALGRGGAIHFDGASHIRLVGLTLRNSYGFGIGIFGPSHHIDVADCDVTNTFAPGIGAWNAAHVRVVGNTVTAANNPAMRVGGDFDRECPHEAISIAGVDGFEVAWNRVHRNHKEGIDVKEVSKNGHVHHNYVHDNPRQGLYADAWFGLLADVAFYSNVSVRNEWGAVISVEGKQSTLERVSFTHNILADNRASGFYFGVWGNDRLRSGITVSHNTIVNNGHPTHWAGPTGSIDLRSKSFKHVRVTNNIAVGGGAFDLATSFTPTEVEAALQERETTIAFNLISSTRSDNAHKGLYAQPHAYVGQGATVVEGEPIFAGGWRIGSDSPAAVAGEGGGHVGALAPGARTLPAAKPSPLVGEGFVDYVPHRFEDWPAVLTPERVASE